MLKPKVREEIKRFAYARGVESGIEKGALKALRSVATNLARAKLDAITSNDERRILAVTDELVLSQLVEALGRAQAPAEARAALDLFAPAA